MLTLSNKYHAINIINKRNRERNEGFTQIGYKFQHLLEALHECYSKELAEFVTFASYQTTEEITLDTAVNYFIDIKIKSPKKLNEFRAFFSKVLATSLALKKDSRPKKETRTLLKVFLDRVAKAQNKRFKMQIPEALANKLIATYKANSEKAELFIILVESGACKLTEQDFDEFIELVESEK